MAKEAVYATLRQLGYEVSDTIIQFSSRFIVEDLRHSFGVFTFDGTQATYRMVSPSECGKYARHDPDFFRDVQAQEGVREGKGIAIVIACSLDNHEAFTQLVYMPFE